VEIDFAKLFDLGFSYVILALIAVGTTRIWGGIWPWFKDEYWPTREARWKQQFDANLLRETQMMDQSQAFLLAIKDFQNGFVASNAEQHTLILEAIGTIRTDIEEYKATNATLVTILSDHMKRLYGS